MPDSWPDWEQLMAMGAGYMPACVLGAAAELDLFDVLNREPSTVERVAEEVDLDLRATRILLDAAAALRLIRKENGVYSLPKELAPLLTADGDRTILPMVLHRANILRAWSQLAWTVKAGLPAPRPSSIRGPEADRAAFVAAMHSVSGPMADDLVARLGPPRFEHLLDVGGASGTWTLAFLRAVPGAKATIFDLPDAIQQARERIGKTAFADRITFAPGDFYAHELPKGADFAWVSAIVHQHSRRHNRDLFAKVHAALVPGGRIAIRDMVMEPDRTHPVEGALFAVNMLANTETGDTFTFEELAEDLQSVGFHDPQWAVKTEDMRSVVIATRWN